MKNLLLIAFIFFGSLQLHAQDKIQWMSMNDALEAQKETPKKIFMDVYTDWCGPCKLLDKNTFGNKDVIKFVNENYYPVKFNRRRYLKIMYDVLTISINVQKINTLKELQYVNQLDFKEVYSARTERKIGEAYRNLHKNDKNKLYKRILELSSKHFKRALKKEKNTINQLNLLYNLKLKGSHKKANKNLEKLKLDKANLSDVENEIIQNIIADSN